MSGDVQGLPPFRIIPHFQAAFGGASGSLNLLVGALTIFRLIARTFDWGLSPVLRVVMLSYTQLFHGAINFVVEMLARVSGIDLHLPTWAHDWIILWFVLAGAAARMIGATARIMEDVRNPVDAPPGEFFIFRILSLKAARYLFRTNSEFVVGFITYVICLPFWPLILFQVHLYEPDHLHEGLSESQVRVGTRVSYRAVFWLQTFAIALAIFGLSVLNAQTM